MGSDPFIYTSYKLHILIDISATLIADTDYERIESALQDLGLGKYISNFEQNEVDYETFLKLRND